MLYKVVGILYRERKQVGDTQSQRAGVVPADLVGN